MLAHQFCQRWTRTGLCLPQKGAQMAQHLAPSTLQFIELYCGTVRCQGRNRGQKPRRLKKFCWINGFHDAAQMRDIVPLKQGRVHCIFGVVLVIEDKNILGAFTHFWGISKTCCEILSPCVFEPFVPRCDAGGQCGLRIYCDDRRHWITDAIGRGRITARVAAVKDDIIKLIQKPIINQPIKVADDMGIAKPILMFADNAQMRPPLFLRQLPTNRNTR